ncbi:MAG: NUDIX domain-containing protein [Bacteroidetes bacterium]|nr:NUDIX domain-containing protein [Bacteroidota bacterium]
MTGNFNIRVYGIMLNRRSQVLVTDEIRFGKKIIKFPGGGLKFGEGVLDCLQREWQEECNQPIEISRHLYTTEFFQASAFDESQQIISIYYYVFSTHPLGITVSEKQFDFNEDSEVQQSFRWVSIDAELIDQITFPIDKKVSELLIEETK